MSTETRNARPAARRSPTRQELTQFYRAIGIPAVASAMQAAKMTAPAAKRGGDLPAFLRDAHHVG
jgi:hypothetical protein